MIPRSSSGSRFNLLLLEDGEYFLKDFSAYRYPPVSTTRTADEMAAR